jgi:hypothetical protein
MHGSTSFDISKMKIGPYLLIDIWNDGEKSVGNPKKWYISPYCPDDPSNPILTEFGKVGDMDEVIKRAKYGVDQLIGAGSAGS